MANHVCYYRFITGYSEEDSDHSQPVVRGNHRSLYKGQVRSPQGPGYHTSHGQQPYITRLLTGVQVVIIQPC